MRPRERRPARHLPARRLGRPTAALAVVLALVLAGCSSAADGGEEAGEETSAPAETQGPDDASGSPPTESPEPEETPAESPTESPTESPGPAESPGPPPHPISTLALAEADLPGGGLRLGAVRERTARFTSYDVTYRSTLRGRGSRPLTISGVLNVPNGPGPFPAVVLAHGYIDPAYYVRGQGMTRERGFLADRGFIALHVDYRNHAESTDDPRVESAVRLGYTTDVIAAVRALRKARSLPVDRQRIALFGRSMGGGVVLRALAAKPDVAAAGVAWASVSSLEAENFEQFMADDTPRAQLRAETRGRHGLPEDDPEFWRGVSSRPYFDRVTDPVLLAHGRFDDTCPPRWARATHRALQRAGADSTLEWYDDAHAFGPAFFPAMERTVAFLREKMR